MKKSREGTQPRTVAPAPVRETRRKLRELRAQLKREGVPPEKWGDLLAEASAWLAEYPFGKPFYLDGKVRLGGCTFVYDRVPADPRQMPAPWDDGFETLELRGVYRDGATVPEPPRAYGGEQPFFQHMDWVNNESGELWNEALREEFNWPRARQNMLLFERGLPENTRQAFRAFLGYAYSCGFRLAERIDSLYKPAARTGRMRRAISRKTGESMRAEAAAVRAKVREKFAALWHAEIAKGESPKKSALVAELSAHFSRAQSAIWRDIGGLPKTDS